MGEFHPIIHSETDHRASNMNMHDRFVHSLKADEGNGKNDGLGIAARMAIAAKADQIRISTVPRTSMKGKFTFWLRMKRTRERGLEN